MPRRLPRRVTAGAGRRGRGTSGPAARRGDQLSETTANALFQFFESGSSGR